jgi:trk system potassium uptake protein TrkH
MAMNYGKQFSLFSYIPAAVTSFGYTYFVYAVPIVVAISFLAQWNYYGTIESLLRRGTFTLIIVVPLFVTWGDFQFAFWLSSVHLLSSTLSFSEKAPTSSKDFVRFSPNRKSIVFWGLKPAQVVLLSFLFIIALGTTLLILPISTRVSIPIVDHLFMVTSAVCVTGLSSVNLGEVYSYFGQAILLLLIQIGGLGIMTLSASLSIFLGKSMAVQERLLMQDILEVKSLEQLTDLILDIIKTTVVIEIIGTVILTAVFFHSGEDFAHSLYLGVFHSVSAFCNAGLSPIGNGLEGFKTNVMMNITITSLIILGGIGFWVVKDVRYQLKKTYNPKIIFSGLSLHSKVVVYATGLLLFWGTIGFFVLEFTSSLVKYNFWEKILISYFQSVTARTAGYNTIAIGHLGGQTLLFLIVLMFIGASPGSTGGGIKTSTFAILWQSVKATLSGNSRVQLFKRTLDEQVVVKAISLTFLSIAAVSIFLLILIPIEPDKNFLDLFFEVVSAFGTVGLSVGITPYLSSMGKILIVCLMYIGRVGPLTLIVGLGQKKHAEELKYPKDKVMIG